MERANETMLDVQCQLEAKILQLQDKLAHASRPQRRGVSLAATGHAHSGGRSSAVSYGAHAISSNVDIQPSIPEGSPVGVSVGIGIGGGGRSGDEK